jgi:hypothetical protein
MPKGGNNLVCARAAFRTKSKQEKGYTWAGSAELEAGEWAQSMREVVEQL